MKKRLLLPLACWLLWQAPAQAQQMMCIEPQAKAPAGVGAKVVPGGGGGDPIPSCLDRKNVKVNFHYILRYDGTGNFNEFNDGANEFIPPGQTTAPQYAADPRYNGYSIAEGIVWAANVQLDNNPQMSSPVGNNIAHPHPKLNFVLQGVYFHRRSDLYDYTNTSQGSTGNGLSSQDQFDQLGKNKDNEINVIVLAQDSNPNYVYLGGIANSLGYTPSRNWVKMLNVWRINWSIRNDNASNGQDNNVSWIGGQLLTHEVGHLLNLTHPMHGDNCADTDGLCGNNVMDYCNAGYAITPCQISTIQQQLNTYWGNYIGSCGCLVPHAIMQLEPCTAGQLTGIWMDARGSFAETSHSIEIAELDVNLNPIPSTVVSIPFSQEAGRVDLSTLYNFQQYKEYQVKLTVSNYCGSNEVIKRVSTVFRCAPVPIERSANTAATDKGARAAATADINIFPNPAHGVAEVSWPNADDKAVPMQLRDATGRVVWKGQLTGSQARIPLNGVKAGIYSLEVQAQSGTVHRRLVVE